MKKNLLALIATLFILQTQAQIAELQTTLTLMALRQAQHSDVAK